MMSKLKSTSGASILLAILLLLLCSVGGSIVLTSATASSGRLVDLRSREKDYYSVTSSARVIKDELKDESYKRYRDVLEVEPVGLMKEFLKKASDYVYDYNISRGDTGFEDRPVYTNEWEIKSSDSAVNDVKAKFYMYNDYSIEILLSSGSYSCKLEVPAVITTYSGSIMISPELIDTRETVEVIWSEGVVTK